MDKLKDRIVDGTYFDGMRVSAKLTKKYTSTEKIEFDNKPLPEKKSIVRINVTNASGWGQIKILRISYDEKTNTYLANTKEHPHGQTIIYKEEFNRLKKENIPDILYEEMEEGTNKNIKQKKSTKKEN